MGEEVGKDIILQKHKGSVYRWMQSCMQIVKFDVNS